MPTLQATEGASSHHKTILISFIWTALAMFAGHLYFRWTVVQSGFSFQPQSAPWNVKRRPNAMQRLEIHKRKAVMPRLTQRSPRRKRLGWGRWFWFGAGEFTSPGKKKNKPGNANVNDPSDQLNCPEGSLEIVSVTRVGQQKRNSAPKCSSDKEPCYEGPK